MAIKFKILLCLTSCVLAFAVSSILKAQDIRSEPETESQAGIPSQAPESQPAKPGEDFNQDFAFDRLKAICEIGPRMSTSKGMAKQQQMLKEHFEALGAQTGFQNFNVNDPRTGRPVSLSNFVVRFHPRREKRIMICCHYDTRPFPDRDPVNPQGVFIGANDGASGAAFLCELGRHIPNQEGPVGFDFVFFDGEEFVFVAQRDPMFLGSEYFAREYANGKWDVKYDYAVLVDMIGDKELQLKMEINSLKMANRLTKYIWSVAKDLKVREFKAVRGHEIRDDHLPLNEIAKIPTCDIIDFDYPNPKKRNHYWHTTQDTVENCSAESLGKVGLVMLEWTRRTQELYKKQSKKDQSSRTARRK